VRSRRSSSRSHLLANSVRHFRGADLRAVFRDDVAVTFAELLLDRVHLLAEQELALPLLHPLVDLGADLVLERRFGQDVAGPGDQHLEPFLHVEGFEHLDLALQGEVRRVAGHVGKLARFVDGTDHLHRLGRAADLQQVLDQRAVLASQQMGSLAERIALGYGLRQDSQRGPGSGGGAPHAGPVKALKDGHFDPIGQFARVLDASHGPEAGVTSLDPRDEEDEVAFRARRANCGLGLVPLERDGHHHVREHDPIVQGQKWDEVSLQIGHG